MPSFKQDFEKNFNDAMNETDADTPVRELEASQTGTGKKARMWESPQSEAEDLEFSEKKSDPPRFSTIFGHAPAAAAAPPEPLPYRPDYRPRRERRRSGMFWTLVVSIALNVVMALMLFAIFLIGFFLNSQARLSPWSAIDSASSRACECHDAQTAINVAPNFIMPQAAPVITETVTVVGGATSPSSLTTSSTSTTTSASTTVSSLNATSEAAAVASDVLGLLGNLFSASTSTSANPGVATSVTLVTVTPTPSTVTSVALVTVNSAGETLSAASTVTSTAYVDSTDATSAVSSTSNQAATSATSATTTAASSTAAAKVTTSANAADTSSSTTASPSTTVSATPQALLASLPSREHLP